MAAFALQGGKMLVEDKIRSIVETKLNEEGYELYSVHYKPGKNASLQVIVDRVAPISLEEIVHVSELVSSLLDQEDPIQEPYTLDVSSLGAEKPIEPSRLGEYVGRYVNLHLTKPYKGENYVEGTLIQIIDGTVELQVKAKTRKLIYAFPSSDVDKARLAIEF